MANSVNLETGIGANRVDHGVLKNQTWYLSTTRIFTLLLLLVMLWTIAFSLFGNASVGLNSQIFRLVTLFILGKIAGVILGHIKIPPMLGMLAIGILLRNVGYLELSGPYIRFASILRQLALVNILLPAGLGLDLSALKRMSWMVLSLAVIPPAFEVISVMLLSVWLLSLPWLWGLLLGLLLSAVSPAVVIPCLFELQDRGYGTDKGIHTLVIAASTLNDIICIAGFGIVLGVIFSKGSLTMQLLEGPIVVALGCTYGLLLGAVARYLPDRQDGYVVTLRTLVVGVGSVLASVGSAAVGFAGAGTLGCIIGAFVACLGWRKHGWGTEYNPVKANFSLLWKFFEPISFGLIGMEVNLQVLEGSTVLWGPLCMLVALLLRIICSILMTLKSSLNLKETVFVALSWIPKATVQAALGPVALDYARELHSPEVSAYAAAVVIVAVMSIVVTSPIGALAIMQSGPRLLNKTRHQEAAHVNPIGVTDDEEANSKL